MITRLYRSKSDIENLSQLKTSIPTGKDRYDYKKYVVNKPWGYEYLMYDNNDVAIWMLYISRGQSTSMHCHPRKKTTLIVIRGEVVCSTIEGFFHLKKGDGLMIDPSVFHKTRAASPKGAIIMEIERPPNKRDLVRLKDLYGREGKGYEGVAEMSKDLSKYEYIDFHGIRHTKQKTLRLGTCVMSLCTQTNKKPLLLGFLRGKYDVICVLSGYITDENNKVIATPGEAITRKSLKKMSRINAFRAIMYLTLRYVKYTSGQALHVKKKRRR